MSHALLFAMLLIMLISTSFFWAGTLANALQTQKGASKALSQAISITSCFKSTSISATSSLSATTSCQPASLEAENPRSMAVSPTYYFNTAALIVAVRAHTLPP